MKEPSLLFGSLQLKIPLGMAVSESGRTLDYTVEPLTCNCLHFSRATSGGCTGRSSNIAVLPVRFEWAREVRNMSDEETERGREGGRERAMDGWMDRWLDRYIVR